MRSSVTTSPREASNGTPPRVAEDFFGFPAGAARPRRAKEEMTRPAVEPSRCASSLAACKTSSSISKVVRMHLMLMHHVITVKSVSASPGPDPKRRFHSFPVRKCRLTCRFLTPSFRHQLWIAVKGSTPDSWQLCGALHPGERRIHLTRVGALAAGGVGDLLEEVVAFVVDEDEGGEVFYFDFPDGFHA